MVWERGEGRLFTSQRSGSHEGAGLTTLHSEVHPPLMGFFQPVTAISPVFLIIGTSWSSTSRYPANTTGLGFEFVYALLSSTLLLGEYRPRQTRERQR